MTAPVSRATFSSSVVVGRGISSASAKVAWSSLWQKYCERNNSGRQMICPPCLAASRMRAIAFSRFAAGSVPHCIWTSAILVVVCILRSCRDGSVAVISAASNLRDLTPTERRRYNKLLHRVRRDDLDALERDPIHRLAVFAAAASGHRHTGELVEHGIALNDLAEGRVFVVK